MSRAAGRADRIRLFTIGFAGRSAEDFFTALTGRGVRRLIDIRLNNVSQLAGFTKKRDLEYFLRAIAGMAYVHLPELAPTQEILDAFKKEKGDWETYERSFKKLLAERGPARTLDPAQFDQGCLLCSEPTPEHCHRRLVAEYLQRAWGNVEVQHL